MSDRITLDAEALASQQAGLIMLVGANITSDEQRQQLGAEIDRIFMQAGEALELEQENARLKQWVDDIQAGMWINCVYCGHRYGPYDGDHLNSMRDALRAHIEQCPKHPLSEMKQRYQRLLKWVEPFVRWWDSIPTTGAPEEEPLMPDIQRLAEFVKEERDGS